MNDTKDITYGIPMALPWGHGASGPRSHSSVSAIDEVYTDDDTDDDDTDEDNDDDTDDDNDDEAIWLCWWYWWW